MDIAITGSSGLIGSALSFALGNAGHRVVPVVRGEAGPNEIGWRPDSAVLDAKGLEGLDAVIHLAGAGVGDARWTSGYRAKIRDSRLDGTSLLARTMASLRSPPPVLLSASAIGYYGDSGDTVLTETSPPADDFLGQVCQFWENATEPASTAGIRVAHLRTGMVLSADGGALGKLLPLFKFGLGGKMGSGKQWMSWVAIDDVVGVVRWLLDGSGAQAGIDGPLNVVAPNPVTNAAFTKILGKVVGRPTLLPIPSFGPKLVLGGDRADALLFDSIRVAPERLTEAGYDFRYPELDTALRAILKGEQELS